MADRQIYEATRTRCIEHQRTAAAFAHDAMYFLEEGVTGAAVKAQEASHVYSNAAQDRLSRLIGVA